MSHQLASNWEIREIGDDDFEEIDLKLIDPGVSVSERLKILIAQTKADLNFHLKPRLCTVVIQYLCSHILGDERNSDPGERVLDHPQICFLIYQGLNSGILSQNVISLQLVYRLLLLSGDKFKTVFGGDLCSILLNLFCSSNEKLK